MSNIEINKLRIEQTIRNLTDVNLQKFLLAAMLDFPEYFWTAPASNTKYHYPDEREEGGLVLHVRRLAELTEVMVRFYDLNIWERDILLASCILHDSFSRGLPHKLGSGSVWEHPLYPRQRFPFNGYADRFITKNVYEEIMECVDSHMGRWSVSPLLHSKRKLPSIFQLIDHLGSRENIKIELG